MLFFEEVPSLPDDPILSLTARFVEDKKPRKVNLGVGTYKTSEGNPYVLPVVREAEARILKAGYDKEYLPILGLPDFLEATKDLVLGANSPVKERTCSVQTIGGSGALRLGGEFLAQRGMKEIYLPEPSWSNHTGIFTSAGLTCKQYPYYDANSHKIDFSAWREAIDKMPAGSVILLHACCHNPTGMDPSREQWMELARLLWDRGIFPFFDLAYQGFDTSLEDDPWPIRYFAAQGHALFVASSFSKNMGLYNERVGTLLCVSQTVPISERIQTQLRVLVRGNYSNPPAHGARVAATVLRDAALRQQWEKEVAEMRNRICSMRTLLADRLGAALPTIDYRFIKMQKGMFSYIGLNTDQAQLLVRDLGLYMPPSGRINIAGLSESNIDYVVQSVAKVQGV